MVLYTLLAAFILILTSFIGIRQLSPSNNLPLKIADDSRSPEINSSVAIKSLCFIREGAVYVRNLRSGEENLALEKRVVSRTSSGEELRVNYSPSLSPSGDEVAFYDRSSLSDAHGTIKILNLKTRSIQEFPELAGVSISEPEWSPDGGLIAFKISKGMRLHVGTLDLASGKWREVSASEFDKDLGVWLDGWMPDANSIVCHNSEFLYRLGLDGSVLFRLPIESFYDRSSVSTATRFSFSADGTRLLFDSGDPDDPAILVYDLYKKALSRITPKDIGAIEPRWLPSEKEILFTCFDPNKKPKVYNICKIALDGSGLDRLIENGRFSSYSTK